MIIKHTTEVNDLFKTGSGAELYVETGSDKQTTISYRTEPGGSKTIFYADSLDALIELLTEAKKLTTPVAQG